MKPPSPPSGPTEASEPTLRLGVSACLLGAEVRFDGGHKQDRFLIGTLGRYVEWFPLCPEVEIGLGTPRESLRLVAAPGHPRLMAPRSGADHTAAMEGWSRRQMDEIAGWRLHGYVLKKDSPSCGLFRVRVYGDGGAPSRSGRGAFARVLCERFPLLPVEEEGRLHDPPLRENFIERVFAYQRWLRLLAEDPTPGGLVRFHTAQKLTVLSHSPQRYRQLGQLVAEAGSLPWSELCERYAQGLAAALGVLATRGKHANVLHHLMGFLKKELGPDDKAELVAVVEDYRGGLVPLVVPVTLLKHHLRRAPVPPWVGEQVYLNPYPKELMLRNHV